MQAMDYCLNHRSTLKIVPHGPMKLNWDSYMSVGGSKVLDSRPGRCQVSMAMIVACMVT